MEMGGVRAESGAGILSCGLRVAGRALGQGPQRYLVQLRAQRRVSAGRLAHGLVGDQVGAGAARSVVLGYGDKELARCVEGGVCLPSGREHPLSEDQVDLPDSALGAAPVKGVAGCRPPGAWDRRFASCMGPARARFSGGRS